MAATISHVADAIDGNKRIIIKKVTFGANSATAEVPTGLGVVDFVVLNPKNGAAYPSVELNSAAAGTATKGTVYLTSGTSAGSYIVVGYGAS